MKKTLALMLLASTSVAECHVYTDEEVFSAICRASEPYVHGEIAVGIFNRAYAMCADTNRFANLLVRLACTNDFRKAEFAIGHLGTFGSPDNIPFLAECVTNRWHVQASTEAIIDIVVSSNSIKIVDWVCRCSDVPQMVKSELAFSLIKKVRSSSVSSDLRKYAVDRAVSYASTANCYFRNLDEGIMRTDPSYRASKRRISVLRSVLALGMNDYQLAYVTNAINELVAYPEAELPN